jgi:hypothetical protein
MCHAYVGFHLVVMITPDGVITDWERIPDNADEREVAWDVLYTNRDLLYLGAQGFLERLRPEVLEEDRDVT